MVVLLYGVEVEILNEQSVPTRDKILREAAEAYRARGLVRDALGRTAAAQADRKTAEGLEKDAKEVAASRAKQTEKIAAAAPTTVGTQTEVKKPAPAGAIHLINAWTEPVTVIIDDVSYRLEVGEQKDIPTKNTLASYELQASEHRAKGTLEAGKSYTVRIRQ